MAGEEDWAYQGRIISRRAHAERDPVQSSEVSIPRQSSSEETVELRYQRYVKIFELTDEDLEEDKSICVIGAADGSFASGLKRARKDRKSAFVMGVDPAEKRYSKLDPAIINHDARDLGFPSDFEGFDLVLSMHAVPKYFLLWATPSYLKGEHLSELSDIFDYEVADREGNDDEIEDAIYEAISEMLRITKPGGKVKMFPLQVERSGIPNFHQIIVARALDRVQDDYPGLEAHLVSTEKEEVSPGGIILPEKTTRHIPHVIELTRPLPDDAVSEESI